jgi:hypothetical protein
MNGTVIMVIVEKIKHQIYCNTNRLIHCLQGVVIVSTFILKYVKYLLDYVIATNVSQCNASCMLLLNKLLVLHYARYYVILKHIIYLASIVLMYH